MKKFGVGVDIGGTSIKIGIFKTTGELVEKWQIPTRTVNNGTYIVSDIATSITEGLQKAYLCFDDIIGVGVGVPGAVLENGVVNKCVNLGWDVFDVGKVLSILLEGVEVRVGNDANLATLGEIWQGGAVGYKDVVLVTLGTGVGSGVVINGKIISGAFGASGEIGHIKMFDGETEQCSCGKTGCLEQYASATGIVRSCNRILDDSNTPSKLNLYETITAKDVFDCAKENDMAAIMSVDLLGKTLGTALSYVSCVVDPEIFIIGGGLSQAGEILIEYIQKHYLKSVFHASANTKFKLATLGNDAGIYGAIKLFL